MAAIKFQKHYVTNGVEKARVSYSKGCVFNDVKLGMAGGTRECVTLYAKDYSRALGRVFADGYVNDTDSQTDYFDQGHVRLFPDHPLYAVALARCSQVSA